jgi:imidazoleglycerol-phosphate dehydratase/histidinol-phosphatase
MESKNILVETNFEAASEDALIGLFSGIYRLRKNGFKVYLRSGEHPLKQQMLREDVNSFNSDLDYDLKLLLGENVTVQTLVEDFSTSTFAEAVQQIILPPRTATINRKTSETDITVFLNLDGSGKTEISTGLGFFDHMLDQIGKHGGIDLSVHCEGDLHIDEHHTIEDVAISLGSAVEQALGNKHGIRRYDFVLPMDESQCTISIDLSGRPYLVFEAQFSRDMVGDFPTEMTEHFFHSLAVAMKATLHIRIEGKNDHHKIESAFKGFARVLGQAVQRDENHLGAVPSSKGSL